MLRRVFVTGILLIISFKLSSQHLEGSRWILEGIDNIGNGQRQYVECRQLPYIEFLTDSTFSGKICNTYKGVLIHSPQAGVSFRFEQQTKFICLGIKDYEKKVFNVMRTTCKMKRDGNNLFFYNTNTRLTYKLEAASQVQASKN